MDHIEAGSRAIFLSSFKNQDMNLAICYLDLDKQLDDCKAESESRLNSYLAQIEATKVALDKIAELEGELGWANKIAKQIKAGIRVNVVSRGYKKDPACLVITSVDRKIANATLLLDYPFFDQNKEE